MACELGALDAEVEEKGRGRRGRCCASPSPGRPSTRRSRRLGDMPLPPYIAGKRADRRPRPARLPDGLRRARRAPSPRRPPACISPTSCSRGLDARGIEPPLRDAACRRRHLPAGEGRRHRRPPHACRMGHRLERDRRARSTRARAAGGRIVAVGTTSLRLLESAAREDGTIAPFAGDTAIFITPGYRFRAVDLLMTNFHLPRSTLFMLVSAFAGLDTMRAAYAHAIANGYRFYSYGDACLLFPADRSAAMTRRLHLHRLRRPTARPAPARSACRAASSARRPSCRSARPARSRRMYPDQVQGARRRHRARQHLSPDAAPGRRARRAARRPARS